MRAGNSQRITVPHEFEALKRVTGGDDHEKKDCDKKINTTQVQKII